MQAFYVLRKTTEERQLLRTATTTHYQPWLSCGRIAPARLCSAHKFQVLKSTESELSWNKELVS